MSLPCIPGLLLSELKQNKRATPLTQSPMYSSARRRERWPAQLLGGAGRGRDTGQLVHSTKQSVHPISQRAQPGKRGMPDGAGTKGSRLQSTKSYVLPQHAGKTKQLQCVGGVVLGASKPHTQRERERERERERDDEREERCGFTSVTCSSVVQRGRTIE